MALEGDHVVKTGPFGDGDHAIGVALVFVGNVLEEQHGKHVVFVLTGIHTAAQLVTAGPEGGVEFGFFDGHEASV